MPNLTQAVLDEIRSTAPKEEQFWDNELKGLAIRRRMSGRMSWIVQYRTSSGVQRKLTLGTWPVLDAKEARRRAKAALGEVAMGGDPAGDKSAGRVKPNFRETAARYVAEHLEIKNKPTTAKESRRLIARHMLPVWGQRSIDDLHPADIAKLHHEMRHTHARRTMPSR